MPRVLLVNTNTMCPPVAPIGFDYLGAAIEEAGFEPVLLDLAFLEPEQIPDELVRAANRHSPNLIGFAVRNTDDCSMATRSFVVPQIRKWMRHLRKHCDAPFVVGGVGFSIFPEEVFDYLQPDYGIAGDGERALVRLVEAVATHRSTDRIPGLVWRPEEDRIAVNRPDPLDGANWPLPRRSLVDNARYMREGGMVGIETKRGCDAGCVYCADPVAKGRRLRCRPPRTVAEEIRGLLDQGADVYHTCDSEFNIPADHGLDVCQAIREAGLADRIRWYAYCTPGGFDENTARSYRRAGCLGINFGGDSGSDAMLARLGRVHRREDILRAVAATKAAGMSCMVDLLLGGPGESRDTIAETIETARASGADRVGLSVGIRLYPNTPLVRMLFRKSIPPHGEQDETLPDLLQPQFWIEPALGESIHDVIRDRVGNDSLFFFMDPARVGANYNYSDNAVLARAIKKGYRGAFWDILRRVAENEPPQ